MQEFIMKPEKSKNARKEGRKKKARNVKVSGGEQVKRSCLAMSQTDLNKDQL